MQVRNRIAAVAALSLAVAGAANAAVPAGAEAIFTTIATDFGTIAGFGFTCFAVVTGGFVVFKIIKKMVSKAT